MDQFLLVLILFLFYKKKTKTTDRCCKYIDVYHTIANLLIQNQKLFQFFRPNDLQIIHVDDLIQCNPSLKLIETSIPKNNLNICFELNDLYNVIHSISFQVNTWFITFFRFGFPVLFLYCVTRFFFSHFSHPRENIPFWQKKISDKKSYSNLTPKKNICNCNFNS